MSNANNNNTNKDTTKTDSPRTYTAAKRLGGESSSSGKSNPFNSIAPLNTASISSPTSGASSAFGLGSGAFASFGSSAKPPKAPATSLDFGSPLVSPPPAAEKREKELIKERTENKIKSKPSTSSLESRSSGSTSEHFLKSTWVVWYRPPTSKYSDYEKSTIPLASFSTVEAFWIVYSHLKRPSTLPTVSDYHIFKKGVRPVWEDDENKRGGKWIVRLKKGVCDRYWEDLLLAMVGDQFAEAGEEVCGAVLSIRSGEDVLSVWTKIDGGRNIKIRYVSTSLRHPVLRLTMRSETIKRLLAFPPDTNIVWRSHDDSIAQRSAIDQARHEKGNGSGTHHSSAKRRDTLNEDPTPEKPKASAS